MTHSNVTVRVTSLKPCYLNSSADYEAFISLRLIYTSRTECEAFPLQDQAIEFQLKKKELRLIRLTRKMVIKT